VAIFLYVLQIHRRDAADQVRQAQELEAGVRHAGNDLDNIADDNVADRSGYKLHGTAR